MDHSLYERSHRNRTEQAFGIALGRITEVFPKERFCTVVTFAGHGSMHDQYIPKCQWLNIDSNPEGDESTAIPRKDSFCVVFFVDGEPFIFGFFKPLSKGGKAVQGNEQSKVVEGDKIFSTVAGNRITVKASGAIEMVAKDTLKRIMFPTGSMIMDFCRGYSLRTDGGTIDWKADTLQQTLYRAEFRKDLLRTFVVVEEKGGVDLTTMLRTTIGPAIPGVPGTKMPVYEHSIKLTGETETTVSLPGAGAASGVKTTFSPEGSLNVKVGAIHNTEFDIGPTGAAKLSVNKIATVAISETGDISVKNALSSAEISASGDITIKGPTASISISVAGEIKIDAANKITLEAKAGVDVKSLGPIAVESLGPVSIKGNGQVSLDGGPGPSDFVLTFPTTLSPFTGAPLTPFSTTVMVSK